MLACLLEAFFKSFNSSLKKSDLLRTRLMAQTPDTPLHYRYRGIVDSFTQTVRKEGPFALWKGLSVSLVVSVILFLLSHRRREE